MQQTNTRMAACRPSRSARFDCLRVVMCLLVVVWHTKTLGPTAFVFDDAHNWTALGLVDIFYFNVVLLAVPTFLAMSGWLSVGKIDDSRHRVMRLKRFGALFLFWSALYSLVFRIPILCTEQSVACYTKKILTGNYSYDTYYLFILMIQDCVLASLVMSETARRFCLPWILVIAFGVTSALGLLGVSPSLSAFYSPLSFAAIPAAIYFVWRDPNRLGTRATTAGFLALAVLCAIGEWAIYFKHGSHAAFPNYARPSLVFGALTLISACQRGVRSSGALLRHLSDATLGVYLVHPFVIVLFQQNGIQPIGAVMTVAVLSISYGVVIILRPLMRQRLI